VNATLEQPNSRSSPVLDTLERFRELVAATPFQPVHQIAEGAVMHWLRVAEGKDSIQPRFIPDSAPRSAFHQGLEYDPAGQLDCAAADCLIDAFDARLDAQLRSVHGKLKRYFDRKGYRSSADACDLTMVELAKLSRFLSTWMQRVEREFGTPALTSSRRLPGASRQPEIFLPPDEPAARVRWCYLLWERLLNQAIVTWEENTLQDFDDALQDLLSLLELDSVARARHFLRPGFPLRPIGRRRMKVAVFSPQLRPLRTKSIFNARYGQLVRRLEEMASAGVPVRDGLIEDVGFQIGMIRENEYQIANESGFLTVGRPGVPTIRGKPSTHPFLLDGTEFFKKAILFDNGTYTIKGGGIDGIYLQVRQLERYLRYQSGAPARRVLSSVDACSIAWEENRHKVFTRELVKIAEKLREAGVA
jgi:hypothetical protein